MTILSVDDSATIRRIVKRSCEELGHAVLEAIDGEGALTTMAEKSGEISLLILDSNMPGLSGFEVLRKVKAEPNLRHIVVLMLTSASDMNSGQSALAAGANDFLTKPFDQRMLAQKIQESSLLVNA